MKEDELDAIDIEEMPVLINVIYENIELPEYLCWYRNTAISKKDWCIDREFWIYATMQVWVEVVKVLSSYSQ